MLWLVAGFASLAGFLFGYDLGLIGGALLNIRDAFGIGEWTAELIVGAAKFGAFFGTFLGGALMLHYGRRKAIAIDSLFFILGPLVMAASFGVAGLVVGRVIVGMGIGISATVVPAYLGEVAPAKARGRVVESFELLLCAGMLAAALGDAAFQSLPQNWRWMVGAPVVPALLLSLSLWLLPESPRWLVIRGRLDEALAVIHRMYTHRMLPSGVQQSTAEVEEELMQLWSSVEKDREAAAAQRQQHAERQRRRQEQRETKVAPLSSEGSPGAGGGGAGGGTDRTRGRWQRLDADEDEEEEGQEREGREPRDQQQTAAMAAAAGQASALEAGAAGVAQRMQAAVAAAEGPGDGQLADAAGAAPAAGDAGGGEDLQRSLLPGGAAAQRSSSSPGLEAAAAQQQAEEGGLHPGQPRPPSRTGSRAERQNGTAAHNGSVGGDGQGSPGGGSDEEEGSRGGWDWEGADGVRQPVTSREGASEVGFWRTLRDMIGDIYIVACGPERQALLMSLWLAFFNQAFASTSIINYAPQVLERAGVESHSAASLLTSTVGGSKMLGVMLSFFLVDSLGRRPLLLWGSLGCAAALAALAVADWLALRSFLVVAMCLFIFAFSVSWAGVFWVLLSELFSMSAKSPAASAATAMLFLTGAIADTLFLTLHSVMGPFVFVLFSILAAIAGLYVAAVVPETKGRRLEAMTVGPASRAAWAGSSAGAAGPAAGGIGASGGSSGAGRSSGNGGSAGGSRGLGLRWPRWRASAQEQLLPRGATLSDVGSALELPAAQARPSEGP